MRWLDTEGRRKGWSPRTYNAFLKAAKAVTRWAEAKDYIARDPLRSLRLAEDPANVKVRRALTVQEFRRLSDWRRFDDLLFCVFTGLRWTEATGIRFMDLDFQRRIITVPKGVGKRDRNVTSLIPMASILVDSLRGRAAIGQATVIRDTPGHRTWRRNIEACGITFETDRGLCVASSLRPTFCQWLAEAGVDNDTRMRLRRDKGMLVEFVYTDRDRLLEPMRESLERTVRWYRRQVERVQVTA
ncbi:MAG: tyrosine-type recombinase/integrase [Planctomycetes bacterium]|nr:tyrosine-type recombinase/integrase [Planctomycetota bacterium]